MTFSIAVYLGALAIGASIGVLTGMFGVGGGFLITPLLNVLLGVPISIAVGTGVVQILGVSTAGIYRRRG
ncbi:MAG: sulfite exporter TauE/SafE family protein, partial [Chloroflexi bacterium]|nr:sulfite exporter TauE/SafE family protein [Chloroflexota bacterium]